jgi:hypothetical protein
MSTLSIVIRADSGPAMNQLLADNFILWLDGGVLRQEIGLLHWSAGAAPAVASGHFWMGYWNADAQGQARQAELQEALGTHYWTGADVAGVLGVPGYAVPTGAALIKHERDKRIENGGYRVGDNWYHSDKTSRDQQMSLYADAKEIEAAGGNMAAPMPNPALPSQPLLWKTLNGPYVAMTPALAIAIRSAAKVQQAALHMTAAQAIAMGTAPESVVWPLTYQG